MGYNNGRGDGDRERAPKETPEQTEARRLALADAMTAPTLFTHSEDRSELFAALAKAQGEMEDASKTAVNAFHQNKPYADLAAVRAVTRPALARNGLALTSWPSGKGGKIALVVILSHTSGQFQQTEYPIDQPVHEPQKVGSAITYARRYAEMAICGIAAEDDDGNATVPQQHGERERGRDRGRREPETQRRTEARPERRPETAPQPEPEAAHEPRPTDQGRPRQKFTAWLYEEIGNANHDWQLEQMEMKIPTDKRAALTDWNRAENGFVTTAIEKGFINGDYVLNQAGKRDKDATRKAAEWLYDERPDEAARAWEDYVERKFNDARAAVAAREKATPTEI